MVLGELRGVKIMDEKRTRTRRYQSEGEIRALGQIVDAMLEAAGDLQNASIEDWRRILIASCRRQKRDGDVAVVATC